MKTNRLDKANDFLTNGIAKYRDQNYIDAIIDFNYANIYNPDNANIYYYRGLAKRGFNDLEGAVLDLSAAVELYRSYFGYNSDDKYWAYYSLASVYIELGYFEEAISNFSKALESAGYFHKSGADYNLYSTRGVLYFKLKKYGFAAADFLKVIMLKKETLSNPSLIKSMDEFEDLYLDVNNLNFRGWTESLVKNYLSKQDEETYVDHFRNPYSKRLYYLGRVEEIENNPQFNQDFLKSIKRRKADNDSFLKYRDRTKGKAGIFLSGISPEDINTIFSETAAKMFEELRQTGHLTPFANEMLSCKN